MTVLGAPGGERTPGDERMRARRKLRGRTASRLIVCAEHLFTFTLEDIVTG